jgi:hypothetical protein
MKKSINLPPKPTNNNTYTILTFMLAITIFCIIAVIYSLYITQIYDTSIEIVKIKYTSASGSKIVDNCGHPIKYSSHLPNNQLNLSDVYKVTINNSMFGKEITSFKLLDKEKYVENCNI